jgi:excisionase family DNA binding protein
LDKLLTLREVADRLRISLSTVRRFIRQGKLPVVKVGNQHRVEEGALQDFIDKGKGSALACASQTTKNTPDTAYIGA